MFVVVVVVVVVVVKGKVRILITYAAEATETLTHVPRVLNVITHVEDGIGTRTVERPVVETCRRCNAEYKFEVLNFIIILGRYVFSRQIQLVWFYIIGK